MRDRFIASFAVIALTLATVLAGSLQAQTTEEGPGPSEQPSAPMEMGQDEGGLDSATDSATGEEAPMTSDSEPELSGEKPAETDQGVARISMIHGDVSTQRGDSGDWSAAALNAPVVTADKVSTADGGRVELQLDFANTLRLGQNSQANIANLTKRNIQIQLSQGIANYTVIKDGDAEPEIDTPNVSVHPSHHDGVFRVEVRPDGDTIVIVRKGEAQISTPQGSTELRSGQMATVRGSSNEAQYRITDAPDRDDWDRWNSDRDRLIQNAQSWKHTNRYYTGTQDLDAYGNWQHVSDYGDVWVPNEDSDWVPYRNGNWVYEPYYGWTWVGYEPWGWAPYHYGRWFLYGSRWAWWPGPVYGGGFYRPFWSPAYVSFFGWGGGWGFGVGYGGWGGFGWLPIGPCDRFYPWWGGYRNRYRAVHFRGGNFHRYGGFSPLHGGNRYSNLARIHDNRMGRALSTVHAGRFGNGPVRAVGATRAQINGARMMTGNMPVVPTRASLSASGRAATPSTIRNGGPQRFFGAHNNVARPTSFQQHTAQLQQSMQQHHVPAVQAGGRTGGNSFGEARGTAIRGTGQKPNAGVPTSNNQMGNPGMRNSGNTPQSTQNTNRGGFRPFTPSGNSNGGGGNNNMRTPGQSNPQSPRSFGSSTPAQSGDRGGFRPFTPPSHNSGGNNNMRTPGQSNTQSPRSFGSSTPAQSGDRGGFRPFTPPSNSGGGNNSMRAPQYNPQAPRSMSPSASSDNGSRGGYRPFTPPSHSASAAPSGRSSSTSSNYWNRTAPSSPAMRGGGSSPGNYGRSPSSRPQLDMRQPVVQPRSSRSYPGGGYTGGSRSAPSYGGSRGSYGGGAPRSAPSYGGSRGSSGGGAPHSTPSYGGSHGSAPSGGSHGGAPSGGGHPSGGGGHSGGGGSHSPGGHR